MKEERTTEKLENAIDIIRTVGLAYGDIPNFNIQLKFENNLWKVKWEIQEKPKQPFFPADRCWEDEE
jgi:predicted nucleic acid-binding protein